MYEAASEELAHQGFEHYELSNWAQRGHRSRHNIVYWTGGQYLGIGAGAHGYLDGIRYENVAHPRRYVEVCREGPLKRKAFDSDWAGGCAIAQGTRPTRSEEIVDFISLGLRLVGGFAVSEFEQRLGVQMSNVVGPLISEVLDSGVLEIDGGMMRLTPRGRLLHSDVASRLIADLQVTPPEAQES
jgi:oxygen-independent coproporphyrinogen-3 oxidase